MQKPKKVLTEHDTLETVASAGSSGADRLLEQALAGTVKLTPRAMQVVVSHLHIASYGDKK